VHGTVRARLKILVKSGWYQHAERFTINRGSLPRMPPHAATLRTARRSRTASISRSARACIRTAPLRALPRFLYRTDAARTTDGVNKAWRPSSGAKAKLPALRLIAPLSPAYRWLVINAAAVRAYPHLLARNIAASSIALISTAASKSNMPTQNKSSGENKARGENAEI